MQELIYDVSAVFLFVVAGCVEAWYASWTTLHIPHSKHYEIGDQYVWNPYRPQWIASTVYSFF